MINRTTQSRLEVQHADDVNGDILTGALLAAAMDYFFDSLNAGDSRERTLFLEDAENLARNCPQDGRAILAAGLLVTGFTVELEPIKIMPPLAPDPEATLDPVIFNQNWRNVLPTILDMGLGATQRGSHLFDENIVAKVRALSA